MAKAKADLDATIAARRRDILGASGDRLRLAVLLNELGCDLWLRFEADGQRRDLDAAIEAYERAVTTGPADPTGHADRLTNLGNALRLRYERFGDPTDLDAAALAFGQALDETPPGAQHRAPLLNGMGNLRLARFHRLGNEADLDASVKSYEQALSEAPIGSSQSHEWVANLGNAMVWRFEYRGHLDDLDAGIHHLQAASELAPRNGGLRPVVVGNHAAARHIRFQQRGQIEDLDAAISLLREAIQGTPTGSPDQARLQANLGNALHDWCRRRVEPSALDEAVASLHRAIALTSPGSPSLAGWQYDLGRALATRHDWHQQPDDLDAAVEASQHAVALAPDSSPHRHRFLSGLSSALERRYADRHDPQDLDTLIRLRSEAITAAPVGAPDMPRLKGALGLALLDRHVRDHEPGDLTAAVDLLRDSCRTGLQSEPEITLRVAETWAGKASERRAWTETVEAGTWGLGAMQHMVGTQSIRADKESWLREATDLTSTACHAAASVGDARQAVTFAEQGRAIMLSEALEVGHYGDLTSTGQGRDPREAVTATGDCPLVYLVAAPTGGFALIASGADIVVVRLDRLTAPALRERVAEHMEVYSRYRATPRAARAEWIRSLDDVGAWLWDAIMGQVLDCLERDQGNPAPPSESQGRIPEAVLIAGGPLGLLPLHATWTPDATRPTGRKYAVDSATIRYTPNARALLAASRLAGQIDATRLLTVCEPSPVSAGPLPLARHEAAIAAAAFPQSQTTLHGRDATTMSFARDAGKADVLHLACHGIANLAAPLESGLLLAGERLNLRRLLELRLRARLAVLSACETAMPGAQLPDEVVSLPTGLLQAGVAGVVASQWAVPDRATAMLMAEFYRQWRHEIQSPAAALRGAQRWLRDTTNAEKLSHFAAAVDTDASWLPPSAATELTDRLTLLDPDQRAQADIHDWGAFAYLGA